MADVPVTRSGAQASYIVSDTSRTGSAGSGTRIPVHMARLYHGLGLACLLTAYSGCANHVASGKVTATIPAGASPIGVAIH